MLGWQLPSPRRRAAGQCMAACIVPGQPCQGMGPLAVHRATPTIKVLSSQPPLPLHLPELSPPLCPQLSPSLPPPPQLFSPPGPGCQSPALAVSPVSQPSRPGPLSPLLTPGPRMFLGDSSVIPLRSPLWRSKNTGLQRGLQADGRKANPAQASRPSPDSAHHR